MTARLALVGAPGSGKSTVAAELARRWQAPVIDTDEQYREQTGSTVAEAVITDESAFRERETRLVIDALATRGAVVAVGSGAVESPAVRAALADVPVVWLQVGLADAARRTGLSGARPLSLGNVRGQLHAMMQKRDAVYESVAGLGLPTDGVDCDAVADRIVEWEDADGRR